MGTSTRRAITAQPTRNGPIRPAGPLTVPSGIWAKTAPLPTTARAEATCGPAPIPPRHTGSRPPSRWISRSRQRLVKVDGALPRNHTRGSVGRAWTTRNGSIQPRCAAPTRKYPPGGRCSWPDVSIRNRSTPKRTKRAKSRTRRYRIDALASGVRPSQARPSTAPPRASASACGESRPGGGRLRRGREAGSDSVAMSGRRSTGGVVTAVPFELVLEVVLVEVVLFEVLLVEPIVLVERFVLVRPERLLVLLGRPPDGGLRQEVRRALGRPTRAVAIPQAGEAGDHEDERHDLGGRDPEERPVVVPEGLEGKAGQAVPDEEDQEQVAGDEPGRPASGQPDQDQRTDEAGHGLVQEQWMEVRRFQRELRAREVRDA